MRAALARERSASEVAAARARELAEFSGADATETARLLWLYVRAEQVRIAIGQLLGFLDDDDVEGELTGLAEAVVNDAVRRVPGAERLLIVALGKFGGRELTFGSDLDLVFIGDDDARGAENAELVRALRQLFSGDEGRDPAFVLDLRLRPHGDVGALAPGVAAYRSYFAASAQTWERQVLTRARVLRGPAELAREWEKFVEETIFARALPDKQVAELWRMRLRIQNERDVVQPPERAFKTGAGGLIDIEYAVQWLQLRHGWSRPALRTPNTRLGWLALEAEGIVEADVAGRIMENHTHLKRIEWCLRRDQNRGVTVIPETAQDQQALARWMDVSDWPTLWENHRRRMHETRELVLALLAKIDSSTTLERGR
jgi:glutamate-ammonia-ligase adenylyltransferase